jgi:arylsulfatase A-like enzyme/tetratricopeptide (TPR) repeat protein
MQNVSLRFRILLLPLLLHFAACTKSEAPATLTSTPAGPPPSILLVTLDTTRADSIGPEAHGIITPSFNALAARGARFRRAYATVPQTLPAHTSLLTGLLPAGHGVHENGRYLTGKNRLLSERLHDAGYRTAAFVSAFALAKRFGLAGGFDVYDDQQKDGHPERSAQETTDAVVRFLAAAPSTPPLFLWVHYYDPHYPYTPPEPFRSRYAANPYLGEIAAMDQQLGRLVAEFEKKAPGPHAIIVVGDHGEGLGEHGEAQHGNLLYDSTMHVPLLLIGPGISRTINDTPVSARRIFQTILDWATGDATNSLRAATTESAPEVVIGEAMKPFLDYGWQPQVMAVEGSHKTISDGAISVYDVVSDPHETHDVAATHSPSRAVRAALQSYPVPSPAAAADATPVAGDDEARKQLASLGYVAAQTKPVVRRDAPRPVQMAALFELLEKSSALFVREEYAAAIPLLEKISQADPTNLDAILHLAVAHSSLGHEQKALEAFSRARSLAPDSSDVQTYLALHYAKGSDWKKALPLLEGVIAREPGRLPALDALALLREKEGRVADALRLRETIFTKRSPSIAELLHQGRLAMASGETAAAIAAFERARALEPATFKNDLELGVLYLAARRFDEARQALDRVPASHPEYAMALFKRAQVSVLLHEPDAERRIADARAHQNAMTRELIARERLFH